MQVQILIGRLLFAAIFLASVAGHFSAQTIGYAASQGVPLANIAVPFSGILALLGGLSVAIGYKAKWGAWVLIAFLVPVTFMLHAFWTVKDPMMAQMQFVNFWKNIALVGGALQIASFGAGQLSLDAREPSESRTSRMQPQA